MSPRPRSRTSRSSCCWRPAARDLTRLAASDPGLWSAILLANGERSRRRSISTSNASSSCATPSPATGARTSSPRSPGPGAPAARRQAARPLRRGRPPGRGAGPTRCARRAHVDLRRARQHRGPADRALPGRRSGNRAPHRRGRRCGPGGRGAGRGRARSDPTGVTSDARAGDPRRPSGWRRPGAGDKVAHRWLLLAATAEDPAVSSRFRVPSTPWRPFGASPRSPPVRPALEAWGSSLGVADDRHGSTWNDTRSTLDLDGLDLRGEGRGSLRRTAPLDCGNSGTTMRLLAGLLAGCVRLDALRRREPLRDRWSGSPNRCGRWGPTCARRTGTLRSRFEAGGSGAHRAGRASAQVRRPAGGDRGGRLDDGGRARQDARPQERLLRRWARPSPPTGPTSLPRPVPARLAGTVPGDPSAAAFVLAAAALTEGRSRSATSASTPPASGTSRSRGWGRGRGGGRGGGDRRAAGHDAVGCPRRDRTGPRACGGAPVRDRRGAGARGARRSRGRGVPVRGGTGAACEGERPPGRARARARVARRSDPDRGGRPRGRRWRPRGRLSGTRRRSPDRDGAGRRRAGCPWPSTVEGVGRPFVPGSSVLTALGARIEAV